MFTAKKVIKSVSDNQHQIISNILQVYNDNQPIDADITYSLGKFYGTFGDILIEQPKYKFDVSPVDDTITKIEPLGPLPLENESIKCCMFDPPFVISPKNAPSLVNEDKRSNIICKRFSSYYPVSELLESYQHWLSEMFRVLQKDGIAIVKCQPTVTGGKQLNSHHFIWFLAECLGFDLIDEFVLICSKGRLISGKIKQQQHARKFHSYFYVLKKSRTKKIKYFNHLDDKNINDLLNLFVDHNKKID